MNLVTGASGILGSHLVLELVKQGEAVVACKQKNSSLEPVRKLFALHFKDWETQFAAITWKDLNVLDLFAVEELLENIDTVYHCAGKVSFNSHDRKQLFEINEGGTRNLVNACLQKPSIQLCHVSSIGTINNSDQNGVLTEDTFWKRSGRENDYALSKYGAEREVWRGMEEGLKAVIVNPGVILAPPFWNHSSSLLVHAAYKNNPFYTEGISAYICAEDAAKIMIQLVKGAHFGQRFILIENNYNIKSVFLAMRQGFGYTGKMHKVAYPLLRTFALLENLWASLRGREPMLTKAAVRAGFNRQLYSNGKVKSLLNYTFMPVEDYLRKMCLGYALTQKSG